MEYLRVGKGPQLWIGFFFSDSLDRLRGKTFLVITPGDIRPVARLCDYNHVLYTWQVSHTEKVLKMCVGF